MPAAAAAASTWSRPPTFTSSKSRARGRQMLTSAAMWQIASHPCAARAIAARSRISPVTIVPGRPLTVAVRVKTTGSWPRAASARSTARPRYPVPPVTSTFMTVGVSGLSSLIKDHLPGGASRLAALLGAQIFPIFSHLAPCHPGAAPGIYATLHRDGTLAADQQLEEECRSAQVGLVEDGADSAWAEAFRNRPPPDLAGSPQSRSDQEFAASHQVVLGMVFLDRAARRCCGFFLEREPPGAGARITRDTFRCRLSIAKCCLHGHQRNLVRNPEPENLCAGYERTTAGFREPVGADLYQQSVLQNQLSA